MTLKRHKVAQSSSRRTDFFEIAVMENKGRRASSERSDYLIKKNAAESEAFIFYKGRISKVTSANH